MRCLASELNHYRFLFLLYRVSAALIVRHKPSVILRMTEQLSLGRPVTDS